MRMRFTFSLMFFSYVACAADETQMEAWRDLARMREASAVPQFEKHAESREARLGLAISLLNTQPRTPSALERAERLLREVEQEGADDSSGVAALYFRARLEQLYRAKPNVQEARRLFEELISRQPEQPLAQLAVVKLAILRLYAEPEVADRKALLDEVSKGAEGLGMPAAIRDFHLVLADAYARWEVSDAESLAHLLAAFRTGELRGKAAGSVMVRIGELSRLQGQTEQAAEFYRRFLKEFPRDARSYTIRKHLEAMR